MFQGDKVQVRWGTEGDIYDAKIKGFRGGLMMRVRFKNMTADWDRWVPVNKMMKIIEFAEDVESGLPGP